jgi:hypothetical protein
MNHIIRYCVLGALVAAITLAPVSVIIFLMGGIEGSPLRMVVGILLLSIASLLIIRGAYIGWRAETGYDSKIAFAGLLLLGLVPPVLVVTPFVLFYLVGRGSHVLSQGSSYRTASASWPGMVSTGSFSPAARNTPSPDRCFKCGKSVSNPSAGVYSGEAFFSAMSQSPYPCKSCGTVFCIDCMSSITKGSKICPHCHQAVGW